MKKTELAVVGLGGVGGYFGFKLALHYAGSSTVRVTFVARGATYDVVTANGLTLLSSEHPDGVAHPAALVGTVAALGDVDVLLVCVKEYDLEMICTQLAARLQKQQVVILPLMNGVDIYERIKRIVPRAIVLPACVYVASHIKAKGVIEHKGHPGRVIVGSDPQRPEYTPAPLVDVLAAAGITIDYLQDAFPAIWTKFFFIASFGLVSARYNQSIGRVNEEPTSRARARLIMHEVEAIARERGIALPPDLIDQTFQKAASFPYHTPTSLQLDVQSGKANTELDLFAGAILHYGKLLALPVTETQKIHGEIKELLAANAHQGVVRQG